MSDDAHRRAAHRTLTGLQPLVEGPVRAALTDVADRFTAAAAALPRDGDVSRLAGELRGWWAEHGRPTLRALLALYEAAVEAVARWLGVPTPAGYQNLPARFDADRWSLPQPVQVYLTAVEGRWGTVGDNLRDEVAAAVAAAVAAGDDPARVRQAAAQALATATGDARAERVAATETMLAWNTATAQTVTAAPRTVRPTVKQWLAVKDHRTRRAHRDVDGTILPVGDVFVVGGVPMVGPGDPTAPLDLVINCRCVLLYGREGEPLGGGFLTDSEVRTVIRDYEQNTPGGEVTAAAADADTGGMIALVPSRADAERLAVPGGHPADELHLTLFFLGDSINWSPEQRDSLVAALREQVEDPADSEVSGAVAGTAFGVAHWNPGGDSPAWVWSVGDDLDGDGRMPLAIARALAVSALDSLDNAPELPVQHSPWVAHVTAAYSSDDLRAELTDRLGPITFDRIRVAFAGEHVDIPLTAEATAADTPTTADAPEMEPVPWSTPGGDAIAFENQQTGDGRVFAPGALYWEGGPWPLQYADEMLSGHEGARLAGAINTLDRDGDRIPATGVLYPSQPAGRDAIMLLAEGAPLGVSVDLDDVDIEVVDRSGDEDGMLLMASLASASVLPLPDGGYLLRVTHQSLTAGAQVTTTVTLTASADGVVSGGQLKALTDTGVRLVNPAAEIARLAAQVGITAAAGDPDNPDEGTIVHAEQSGDFLLRITRGRVRGATLVSVPAFANARITLDGEVMAAADTPTGRLAQVVTYVAGSPVPVDAATTARALGITVTSARDHLARAATAGYIVRLARGLYVAAATLPETPPEVTAAASGNLDLPIVTDRDTEWDGDAAASRVLEFATNAQGDVDPAVLGSAFLYRDPDANPGTLAAYKLGFADVRDGHLRIVPRGVFAVAAALQGARGGVDIPDDDRDAIRDRVEDLYERINEAFPDAPPVQPPWDDDRDDDMDELEASAWQAMRSLPPMPAAWFREPTPEELPPDSGGVHYRDGRIYGWVAQAGVPHQGFPGRRLTIDSLGAIDTTHFLRAEFPLDDGSTVRVGAFTMNVGHHRDGAECETAACQFDDTRTVAGIVTVGVNRGGMWFSGAAAPWLSEWDTAVFAACQPSYHMKREGGRWSLRAVLSVPVPGHPSRLAAAAVDRSNLALAASAAPAAGLPSPVSGLPAIAGDGNLIAALARLDLSTAAAASRDGWPGTGTDSTARSEVRALADRITVNT